MIHKAWVILNSICSMGLIIVGMYLTATKGFEYGFIWALGIATANGLRISELERKKDVLDK